MELTIEIHCSACGSANFSLPDGSDETVLSCNDCCADLGTVGELRSEMLAQALALSAEARRRDLTRPATPDRA